MKKKYVQLWHVLIKYRKFRTKYKIETTQNLPGGMMNGIPAYDKRSSKKDQYSRPFSQTRDAGSKIARFHPGHNAALKNLSFHWKNRTFQVKSKTTKKFNKAGHYNSFFSLFCSSTLRHNEGGSIKPLLINRISS